jgi:hypothetical protein
MRLIALALVVLYVTGTALVLLNLANDADPLADPKLQAKLALVVIRSLNALALRRITFPALARGRRVARWKSIDLLSVAVPVALSNCLWMYCAFLGIARPWNRHVTVEYVFGIGFGLFVVTLVAVWALLLLAAQDLPEKRAGMDRSDEASHRGAGQRDARMRSGSQSMVRSELGLVLQFRGQTCPVRSLP